MAISPPGDIIMNVVRAADPEKVAAARTRLQAASGGQAAFSASFGAEAVRTAEVKAPTPASQAEVKFEAMILQNFLQEMLPKENSALYGEGMAGEMWRSMLSQQLGEVLARDGGIGIARSVLGDHIVEDEKKIPIGAVSSTPEQEAEARQHLLSSSLLKEIERQVTQKLGATDTPNNGSES